MAQNRNLTNEMRAQLFNHIKDLVQRNLQTLKCPLKAQHVAETFMPDGVLDAHRLLTSYDVSSGLTKVNAIFVRVRVEEHPGSPLQVRLWSERSMLVMPALTNRFGSHKQPILDGDIITKEFLDWVWSFYDYHNKLDNMLNGINTAIGACTSVGQMKTLLGAQFMAIWPDDMKGRGRGARETPLRESITAEHWQNARDVASTAARGMMFPEFNKSKSSSVS